MTTPTEGIWPGVPFDEYRQIEAVNSSFLWTLRQRCPRRAWYEREHPKEPTPALRFGTLLHLAVLEPARFASEVVTLPSDAPRHPDRRQREAKKPSPATIEAIDWWDDWETRTAGRIVVTTDELAEIQGIERAIRIQQCHGYVTGGRAEVVLVWRDRVTGLWCKGRLDYLHEGWDIVIVDLKTTEDASRAVFAISIYNYGYFQSAAFYLEGYETLTGVRPSAFTWLAVEKEPPYIAKPWDMDEIAELAGQASYGNALAQYAVCLEKNEWPAYGDGPDKIGLPPWALVREGFDPFSMMIKGTEATEHPCRTPTNESATSDPRPIATSACAEAP